MNFYDFPLDFPYSSEIIKIVLSTFLYFLSDRFMESENNTDKVDPQQTPEPQDVPLPEPSLIGLVAGLASQAMVSMGMFPHPVTGKSTILLNQSKHLIETIVLIDNKTKGNQSSEETLTLANIIHELRMIFVAAQKEKQRNSEVKGNEVKGSE